MLTPAGPIASERRPEISGTTRRSPLFRLAGRLAECRLREGGRDMGSRTPARRAPGGTRPEPGTGTGAGRRRSRDALREHGQRWRDAPWERGHLARGGLGPGTGARGRAGVPFRLLVPIPSSLAALLLAAGCAMPLPAAEEEPAPAPILPLVQTPPPVPKPAPGEPVETWSVSVEDVPVRELLFALAAMRVWTWTSTPGSRTG